MKNNKLFSKFLFLILISICLIFFIGKEESFAVDTLPRKYNLSEHYNIKVKNQGSEGTCWTFAALETLETYLQIHGYGTFDFSENHLNYIESNLFPNTQALRRINSSGNYINFKEYVNNKFGPVSEKDYPYYEDENSLVHKEYSYDELENLLNVTPLAYVGEYADFPSINKDTTEYLDTELLEFRNTVKTHIMENGALFTLVTSPDYFKNEYYNEDTYGAYFPTTNDDRFSSYSHAVAIIGWDDDFAKENFVEENRPEHDGAYIALNSWGTKFGDEGVYYISYDDAFVEQNFHGVKEASTDISKLKNVRTFTIKDENLYNALKNVVGNKAISYNDDIKQITILNEEINLTNSLNLVDYGITDLSGIENFTNLYSLNLSDNNLSDISPLLSLDKLKDLNLRYNNFTTIPEELQNAELDSLDLSYNPINDFSGFAKIKSVTRVDLEGTSIKEEDLNYIKNLKIIILNLSKTNIKDYSILKTLNNEIEDDSRDFNIQQLNVSYNNDIIYSSLPNVMYLILSYTDVDENKFNQILDTSNLDSLDISYTNVKDLSILSGKNVKSICISGNRDLENFENLKYAEFITYEDAGLSDMSIFNEFYCSQLNIANNEIEDYSDLLNSEYLRFVDLSNNKIKETLFSDEIRVFLDGNNIKPVADYYDTIESMKNLSYTETIEVDPERDNIFKEIGENLINLRNSGMKISITNATMDYDNNVFKIDDYDKDVVIKIENGVYDGSTITYKIEKMNDIEILYIYIDRTNLKTTYIEGEQFDESNIKVYASYTNNSICQINDFTVTGGEDMHVGNNQIKIEKDGFIDLIDVNVISSENILTLSFENKDIYDAVLNKIDEIEKERRQYPEYYNNLNVLISKDDENKKILILKDDLQYISYIKIKTDDAISLEDTKQLKSLTGMSIDGPNVEDLSTLTYFKELLDENEELFPYEKFLSLEIKNNEKITKLDNDIYKTLIVENSNLTDINNLSKLSYINYKGSKLPYIDNILDTIRMITINVTENQEDVQKDENSNLILPNLLKELKDRGLEIEVNICDQLRDEQYLNAYKKYKLDCIEKDGKLIINNDDIKNIEFEGSNQFIEIRVKDVNSSYMDVDFKYKILINVGDNNNNTKEDEKTDDITENEYNKEEIEKLKDTPKTGDNIGIYITIFVVSIVVFIIIIIVNKKKKINKGENNE